MALALTAGGESRLDGAPDLPLPGYEDLVNAVARSLVEQDVDGALYGGDPQNAMGDARKYAAEYVAGQQRATAANRAAAEGRAGQATPGQRSISAPDAEQAAYQNYANQEIAGLRALGPRGGEATPAADMRRNIVDMPYSMEPTGFDIDNEQTLREEYARRFGRPPRTPEEVQLARALLVDEAQERMRGAGTWGAQVPFESEAHRDAYRSRTPRQYSQEQADMMQVQGGGMGSPQGWVLVYHPETGRLTPMQRAPDPTVTPDNEMSLSRQPAVDGEGVPTPGTSNRVTNNRRVGPGVDRLDVQPELRNPQMEAEGYIAKFMDGPQGPEWVYEKREGNINDPNSRAGARQKLGNWQERQRRQRLASRSGLTADDAAQQLAAQYEAEERPLSFEDRLRMQGDLARMDDKKERRARVREQAMLAGGQPTGGPGGTRATTNAINELGPGWREIAMLDRLTQGRQGGPTPLGVQAANMQNSIPVIRSILAGAAQGLDPAAQANARLAQQLQLAQMPPEQRVGLSIQMQEPMGTGHSAAHVGARWNHWTNNLGPRPASWRDQNFRMEMEGLGYTPEEIDAWVDRRKAAEPPAPAAPRPGRRRGGR
jgi:hypothetical protein